MEHINRLKRVHQDSVDLMKTEFMSQIARLKVSEFSANSEYFFNFLIRPFTMTRLKH